MMLCLQNPETVTFSGTMKIIAWQFITVISGGLATSLQRPVHLHLRHQLVHQLRVHLVQPARLPQLVHQRQLVQQQHYKDDIRTKSS